jgi:hypothetical protein
MRASAAGAYLDDRGDLSPRKRTLAADVKFRTSGVSLDDRRSATFGIRFYSGCRRAGTSTS